MVEESEACITHEETIYGQNNRTSMEAGKVAWHEEDRAAATSELLLSKVARSKIL